MERRRARAWLVVTLIGVISLSWFKINDYDIWLHLSMGRYCLERHAVPEKDWLTCTAYGEPFISHEWLFDTLVALLYERWGVEGWQVAKIAVHLAGFGALFLLAARRGIDPALSGLMAIAAAASSRPRLLERPEGLSFTLWVLTLFVLDAVPAGWRRDALLAALVLVWVNLHSGVIWGLALLGLTIAEDLWRALRQPPEKRRTALIAPMRTGALAGLAAGCTPIGYDSAWYPFHLMLSGVTNQIGTEEWLPPSWGLRFRIFWGIAALTVVTLPLWVRRLRLSEGLNVFVLLATTLKSRRQVLTFAPAGALAVGAGLEALRARWRPPPALLDAICFAGSLGAIGFTLATAEVLFQPGWGSNPNSYPEGCRRFLVREGLGQSIYNSYSTGSFLGATGPEGIRVFLDGRDVLVAPALRALQADPLDTVFDERWRVDVAVVNYPPREFSRVAEYFAASPKWRMVYWDDVAIVYLRTTAFSPEVFARCSNEALPRIGDLLSEQDPSLLAAAAEEIQRILSVYPECRRARFFRAQLAIRQGRYELAASDLAAARDKFGDTARFGELESALQATRSIKETQP